MHLNGFVFHGGYIAVCAEANEKYGLMDKTGKMVLPIEYDYIGIANNLENWCIEAIGPDTYLCTVSDGDKVVVNGKGEVVR